MRTQKRSNSMQGTSLTTTMKQQHNNRNMMSPYCLLIAAIVLLSSSSMVSSFSASTARTPKTMPSPVGTPKVIQGGMGVRISSYQLAREVAKKGQLGVISGTAMDTILLRQLQDGDKDGAMRRALASFPDQDMARRFMDKYFIENGKDELVPYKHLPMWTVTPSQELLEAAVLSTYAEVWNAKHNEDGTPIESGWVGMNLLTKVQLPTIPSLYGAMLADVDYILMGAGIPMQIPRILDSLAAGEDCKLTLDIEGTLPEGMLAETPFSPASFWNASPPTDLKRPNFVPIVSSVVLAQSMMKRASGKGEFHGIDGFVVELPTAGGHNAPPRGFRYDPITHAHDVALNTKGEPVYGEKDEVDLLKFAKATKGLPFWMAGSYAKPELFSKVIELGGAGVQVGTAFALAQESGMKDATRQEILKKLSKGDLEVYTDPVASPTGFPFKVLELPDTLASDEKYAMRPRVCNLGYLRTPYVRPDGKIGYRCASEPIDQYVKKGGSAEATEGRKCLCNALCADAGMPQVRSVKGEAEPYVELPLVTIGNDVNRCRRFMKYDETTDRWSYSAGDVIDYLLSEWETSKAKMDEVNAVSEGLAEYLVTDFEAHEADWSKLPSDRTSIDVVPSDLAAYMVSDWESHQPKAEAALSKSSVLSESSLPKGLAEYLLSDFEAHEKDWDLEDPRASANQLPNGLANYMVTEWEARHEFEKKAPKIDDLSKSTVPDDLAEYLIDEWEDKYDSYASVATMTVHGLSKNQDDVSP
jgi:nitronate monooxygenase